MKPVARAFALAGTLALLALMPLAAAAADAQAQVTMRDPWVPPAVRRAASAPTTQGAALNAQVEKKLRAHFDAADADHDGLLTLAEAQAAKLGVVANQFGRIDMRHTGRVSFEDLKRYLRGRGATTL